MKPISLHPESVRGPSGISHSVFKPYAIMRSWLNEKLVVSEVYKMIFFPQRQFNYLLDLKLNVLRNWEPME